MMSDAAGLRTIQFSAIGRLEAILDCDCEICELIELQYA